MADADPIQRLNAALEDRYRIERELGAGGMATVYLTEDVRHHRNVALKVLKPELAAVVGAERFLAEIETTANLQHPHILPLFDSGEADGFLFYVMPYLEGESLRARLDRKHQLPVDEAVEIASKVASALDYAHRRGVIHRDIKPANILLNDTGEPLVSDFGIALAVSAGGGDRLTETGLSLGTPHYMSPEQATGDRTVAPQTDMWALGCVLYEMLVGEPPFTGGTPQAVLGKIITADVPHASADRASVPPNVDAAIAMALERVPADRFRSAGDFAQALGDRAFAASGRDTDGESPRRLWRAALLAALVGILAGILGWAIRAPNAVPPIVRFTVPVPDRHEMWRGLVPSLAISPDGRTLVYRSAGQLFKRRMDQVFAEPIDGSEGAVQPFFSADGRSIGFVLEDRIHQVPTTGGDVTRWSENPVGVPRGIWWGQDGSVIYAPPPGAFGIWRLAPSAVPEQLTVPALEFGETGHQWPQAVEGQKLLYTVIGESGGWADARVVLHDLERGERITVAEHATYGRFVGRHVVYVTSAGEVVALPYDIRRGQPEGAPFVVESGVRVAQWGGAASLAITDGAMAFVEGTTFERFRLVWIDRDGSYLGQVGPPFTGGQIDLSPVSGQILLNIRGAENDDIWTVDVTTGQMQRQTFGEAEDESSVWSPDGTRFAYRTAASQGSRIQVKSLHGGVVDTLLQSPLHIHLDSWSPDGRWLGVEALTAATRSDVYRLDLERPERLEPLVASPADEYGLEFAPNGGAFAYNSTTPGGSRSDVFVRSESGGLQQVSRGGGQEPRWSADGSELFFWRGDTLFSVPSGSVGGEPLFVMSDVGDGFELPVGRQLDYAVSNDGERFLVVVTNPDSHAREIHVTQNWLSPAGR